MIYTIETIDNGFVIHSEDESVYREHIFEVMVYLVEALK